MLSQFPPKEIVNATGRFAFVLRRHDGQGAFCGIWQGKQHAITLFADADKQGDGHTTANAGEAWDISTLSKLPTSIGCKERGGFVLVIRK